MDYAALRSELLTDPTGLGYAAMIASGSDHLLADALNAPRSTYPVDRGPVPSSVVAAGIPAGEFAALQPAQRDYVGMLISAGEVHLAGTLKNDIVGFFPAASASRAHLRAISSRDASRAEYLGLETVSPSDIAVALRGGSNG